MPFFWFCLQDGVGRWEAIFAAGGCGWVSLTLSIQCMWKQGQMENKFGNMLDKENLQSSKLRNEK